MSRNRNNKMSISRGKVQDNTGDFVLRKAQSRVSQQVYGGVILLLAGLMWFNAQSGVFAGDNNKVDTNIVISAGVLEVLNTPASLRFADRVAGVAGTSLNDLDNVVIRDYRGSGNQYWSLRLNSSNMNSGSNTIAANNVQVWPGNAVKTNLASFDTAKVGVGEGNAITLDAVRNIFNSTYNASGALIINSIRLGVTTSATLPAATYAGGVLVTIVATNGT